MPGLCLYFAPLCVILNKSYIFVQRGGDSAMKKHAKYLVLAVTLGIMALIFFFSSQPGETSYQLSGAVADTVQHSKVSAITPSWFSAQNFNANIRKWAHVYIYCALGVSMAVTVHLWTRCIALWQQGLLAAALCTLYAMSDEIHQYFVPARAMLLADVGIDGFGFLPCIAVTCIIIWLLQRRKAEQ